MTKTSEQALAIGREEPEVEERGGLRDDEACSPEGLSRPLATEDWKSGSRHASQADQHAASGEWVRHG